MVTTIILICFLFFYNIISPVTAQEEINNQHQLITAKIDTSIIDSQLLIEGKFNNKTDSSFQISYKMVTNKMGSAGTSKSAQSGRYLSNPNSEILLNKLGLNIDEDMRYEITLEVFSNNKLIAQDTLFYNISD